MPEPKPTQERDDLPGGSAQNGTAERTTGFLEQTEVNRQVLDAITDMVLVKGEHSRIVWANKAFRDYYGMSNEQLRLVIDAPFNAASNTEQYIVDDHRVFTSGETLNIAVEPVTRFDGEVRLFNTVKSAIRDRNGRVHLTVGVSRDITEKRKVEEDLARHREHLEHLVDERTRELRETTENLQILIRSLVEGVVAVDARGGVKLMNPAAEQLTGWPGAEAAGRDFSDLLVLSGESSRLPIPPQAQVEWLEELARTGDRLVGNLRSRDGSNRLVSVGVARLTGPDGLLDGCVLIIRDVTEERKQEDQRLRHQKLESLGLLAGGIAHDFNNILMGILGNISLTRYQLEPQSEMALALAGSEAACMRAQELATQLLTFAKGGAPVKKIVRLEGLVRAAAELATRGSLVTLDLHFAHGIHPVEADAGQLEQAVNNLVINARQAMPGGGRIVISVENATLSAADHLPLLPGPYVRTTVRDSGPGIPAAHLSQIFDPYFTTKEKGSGLGLASVHSIIARHGGHVMVSSPPGEGASFTFFLPASPGAVAESAANPRPAESIEPKFLLVLDDDRSVREIMQTMLVRLGHRVTAAATSAEALSAFQRALDERQPYDAAFVDLTMPGDLPGEEVIKRILALEPCAKLIAMTGYSTNPVIADYKAYGLSDALTKPFSLEVMRNALARCLADSPKSV